MYRRLLILVLFLFMLPLVGSMTGCVYYNTFYNAKREFKQAEKYRKQSGTGSQSGYKVAIDKALKVIENHPNSKYYDDALYVLGVSYFYTGQHEKAERRFRELLANYPESKFAREGTLYLARAKLSIKERDAATDLFEEIFEGKYDKQYKAEAAIELGKHYLEQKEFELARTYFLAVRDSLGNDKQKLEAQQYVADASFGAFRFGEALSDYLQILGMKPTKNEKYHALYHAALCSYRLQRIADGLEYLEELTKDQLYFDSLGVLKLTVAQGYEYAGELEQAEGAYLDVAQHSRNNRWVGEAYYQLGLIYQYDYDDLRQAKIYYDKAVQSGSGGESGQDAIQRSADIARLQSFTEMQRDTALPDREIDTTVTEEEIQATIDDNASTLLQLSQLYWFQLNKPDSAVLELQNLITRYPTSKLVPRAMMTLAIMRREQYADTLGADSILRTALQQYPRSDYVPELLAQLNLANSEVDTGYAARYYHRAEEFFVDMNDIDSALYYYQYVVDHFPESEYYLQARFNIIWLEENYRSPGDSSIYFAYRELVDSFPGTPQAAEANKKLTYRPPERKQPKPQEKEGGRAGRNGESAGAEEGKAMEAKPFDAEDSSRTWTDPRQQAYTGPKGEHLILLDANPSSMRVEFDYPPEASSVQGTDFELYFQILLDFSGKVVDYVLKVPGPHDEINRLAGLSVASMEFDPLEMQRQLTTKAESLNLPEEQQDARGRWFVYKFIVRKPDYLR